MRARARVRVYVLGKTICLFSNLYGRSQTARTDFPHIASEFDKVANLVFVNNIAFFTALK